MSLYKQNPDSFLRRFIIMMETRIHHYILQNKKLWTEIVETKLNSAKAILSITKVAECVWDVKRIIFITFSFKMAILTILSTIAIYWIILTRK